MYFAVGLSVIVRFLKNGFIKRRKVTLMILTLTEKTFTSSPTGELSEFSLCTVNML